MKKTGNIEQAIKILQQGTDLGHAIWLIKDEMKRIESLNVKPRSPESFHQFSYKDMMSLRSAYNHGIRTDETRAAARQYINHRRLGKLNELREQSQ